MNSITGRKRPSSAIPPPRPANAFSLIGVPSTRLGYFSISPLVAPLVPPLRRCTSSPRTTMRLSVSMRRSITAATASTKRTSSFAPVCVSNSAVRAPFSSDASPRTPTFTKSVLGQSSARILRAPGLPAGSASSSWLTASSIAACACARTPSTCC